LRQCWALAGSPDARQGRSGRLWVLGAFTRIASSTGRGLLLVERKAISEKLLA